LRHFKTEHFYYVTHINSIFIFKDLFVFVNCWLAIFLYLSNFFFLNNIKNINIISKRCRYTFSCNSIFPSKVNFLPKNCFQEHELEYFFIKCDYEFFLNDEKDHKSFASMYISKLFLQYNFDSTCCLDWKCKLQKLMTNIGELQSDSIQNEIFIIVSFKGLFLMHAIKYNFFW